MCRPDCPGLDPETGERLTDLPDSAERETIDPRWAALAELAEEPATHDLGTREEDHGRYPPKRKVSRSNTRSRRAQWKAEAPTLVKTIENGKVVYSRPHQAKVVTDSQGTELFLEYKGRKVADI